MCPELENFLIERCYLCLVFLVRATTPILRLIDTADLIAIDITYGGSGRLLSP